MRFPTTILGLLLTALVAAPATAAALLDLGTVSLAAPTAFAEASTMEANENGKGGNGHDGGSAATQDVTIQLNLTGVGTRTDGGPDDGFVAYVNVTGQGVRRDPNGNGVQIWGRDLTAEVKIVRTSDNTSVAEYTALVDFHGQEASSIAQGLDAGNFRFNLGLHGQRSENVVAIEEGDRIMAMNAHGFTTGPADEDGFHAVQASGQTTLKAGGENSATHYNVALGGIGAILATA